MSYTIEQIKIGDQVAFNSTPHQDNRDLFWQVVGKSGTKLAVELKKYIWDENFTIDVKDVKGVLKYSL